MFLAAVRKEEIGSASVVITAVQAITIASSDGVAIFASVFFDAVGARSADEAFRQTLPASAIMLTPCFG
jgi:hypothetical protein